MVFSSMIFIWCFLPIVLIGYYIIVFVKFKDYALKNKCKNIWLLLASLIFYAWGGTYYIGILLGIIVIDYTAGLILKKCNPAKRKTVMILGIVLNLLTLFVFKYSNMVAGMLGADNWTEIALPLGISFFTFQAMSYVIDVYRNQVEAMDSIADFALYVSFFPQLIAGPIVKYKEVKDRIAQREESADLFYSGARRFCYGIGKKVLIANYCGEIADGIWAGDISQMGASVAWLGVLTYSLHIYYDFSGYSDMAIGLGRMFGFEFSENFNYPYMARSVRDFWRRWHISLSTWFKDYVYIPLGGNRKGRARTCFNLFVVFLLTGIWHGADLSFFLWGAIYGVILVIERVRLGEVLEKNPVKILNYIYTLLTVSLCWILFRADNMSQAFLYYSRLFAKAGNNVVADSFMSMKGLLAIVFGLILMGPAQTLYRKYFENRMKKELVMVLDIVCQMAVLAVSVLLLVGGTYNPFIYFIF